MRSPAFTQRLLVLVFLCALAVKLGAFVYFGALWTPDSRTYVGLAREFAGQTPFGSTLPDVNYRFLY